MRRFVQGLDRGQSTLFPECLEDWIGEDNPVRVIDVFVDELDLVMNTPRCFWTTKVLCAVSAHKQAVPESRRELAAQTRSK
jgi:hypothetical protein